MHLCSPYFLRRRFHLLGSTSLAIISCTHAPAPQLTKTQPTNLQSLLGQLEVASPSAKAAVELEELLSQHPRHTQAFVQGVDAPIKKWIKTIPDTLFTQRLWDKILQKKAIQQLLKAKRGGELLHFCLEESKHAWLKGLVENVDQAALNLPDAYGVTPLAKLLSMSCPHCITKTQLRARVQQLLDRGARTGPCLDPHTAWQTDWVPQCCAHWWGVGPKTMGELITRYVAPTYDAPFAKKLTSLVLAGPSHRLQVATTNKQQGKGLLRQQTLPKVPKQHRAPAKDTPLPSATANTALTTSIASQKAAKKKASPLPPILSTAPKLPPQVNNTLKNNPPPPPAVPVVHKNDVKTGSTTTNVPKVITGVTQNHKKTCEERPKSLKKPYCSRNCVTPVITAPVTNKTPKTRSRRNRRKKPAPKTISSGTSSTTENKATDTISLPSGHSTSSTQPPATTATQVITRSCAFKTVTITSSLLPTPQQQVAPQPSFLPPPQNLPPPSTPHWATSQQQMIMQGRMPSNSLLSPMFGTSNQLLRPALAATTIGKPFEKLAKIGVCAIKKPDADIISIPDGYSTNSIVANANNWSYNSAQPLGVVEAARQSSTKCSNAVPFFRGNIVNQANKLWFFPLLRQSTPELPSFKPPAQLTLDTTAAQQPATILEPFEKLAEAGAYAIKNLDAGTISIRDAYNLPNTIFRKLVALQRTLTIMKMLRHYTGIWTAYNRDPCTQLLLPCRLQLGSQKVLS